MPKAGEGVSLWMKDRAGGHLGRSVELGSLGLNDLNFTARALLSEFRCPRADRRVSRRQGVQETDMLLCARNIATNCALQLHRTHDSDIFHGRSVTA